MATRAYRRRAPRRTRKLTLKPLRWLIRLVWHIFVSCPAYVFLFWIWWPRRSRVIALGPDPYDTLAWEFFRTRVQVLNRRKYGTLTCEHCHSQRSGWYEVHHIHRRADRPDLFLWLPNLMLLCRGCHLKVHEGDGF